MKLWKKNKHLIDTPFVAMYVNNENWGWLSTIFPNRTTTWETCETPDEIDIKEIMMEFLNDSNTIALIVNQHHNYTHPKIITIPLGLPDDHDVDSTIFEAMHTIANNNYLTNNNNNNESKIEILKSQLLFVASSNWGSSKILYYIFIIFLFINL